MPRTRHDHQHHQARRRRPRTRHRLARRHGLQHRRLEPDARASAIVDIESPTQRRRRAARPRATTVLGQPQRTPRPRQPCPGRPHTVDELVDVDGGRLHVRCVGAGDTTVVLIAGFNDGGDNWGRIEPALSQRARVCSSARFGTGLSDPPTAPQTFATSARDLHTLLGQIGEPGPYVVVGHSYGGAQAVTFAAQYRDEVDGLLLLDATPPTWTAAGCAVPDDGSEAAADFIARCPDPAHPTDNPEQLDIVARLRRGRRHRHPRIVAAQRRHRRPASIPRSRPGRGNAPRRRVESGPAALDVAVVGRPARHRGRHRPLHPTRPTRCRHRRDPTTPPGASRAPRRRHRFGGRPAATAWSAAPSTSPSTPPTRPAPRSTWRWLASQRQTRTPGSAH